MDNNSLHTVLNLTENRSRIFAVIVAMVHDFDLAEELFQETIMEILKSESTFDASRSFVPWACGVARNVVRQHWRRQKASPTNGARELLSELATIVQEGDDDLWKHERRALRSCLQRLPDRMQRLLILRYGHNLKGKELAESTSIRAGSVRTTLARLRKQLQDCIRLGMPESEVATP